MENDGGPLGVQTITQCANEAAWQLKRDAAEDLYAALQGMLNRNDANARNVARAALLKAEGLGQ